MNREINHLFFILDELRKLLTVAVEKAGEASELAKEISGEFDQEISTDLKNIQVKLSELLDDLDSSIGEGRTLKDDEEELEKSLRGGLDDEENYNVDSERIQEEIDEDEDKA